MRGKVMSQVTVINRIKDHPRLCGEKSQKQACESFNDRITPAYAGKSGGNDRTYTAEKDHPRLCGEKDCRKWRGKL